MGSNAFRDLNCLARIHRREDGMFSVVQLVVVLFFAMMAAFFFYIVYAVEAKTRWQNAADSSARAAATAMARGMNAICVSNHLIGESVGLLIVHEAVAGRKPKTDSDRDFDPNHAFKPAVARLRNARDELEAARNALPSDESMQAAYTDAMKAAEPYAYDALVKEVVAKGMLSTSIDDLRDHLTQLYLDRLDGMRNYNKSAIDFVNTDWSRTGVSRPEKVPANIEEAILREYGVLTDDVLKAAENVANADVNDDLRNVVELAMGYIESVKNETPNLARGIAESLASTNGVQVALTPTRPELPIEQDPLVPFLEESVPLVKLNGLLDALYDEAAPRTYFAKEDNAESPCPTDQIAKVTQLARASFPWVVYHREPMLEYLRNERLILSGAEKHYLDQTAGTAKSMLREIQQSGGEVEGGLYVLKGATLVDKGYEQWRNDPALLAKHFAVTCRVVHRPAEVKKSSLASDFFSSTLPTTPTATATAILYNGNQQQPHAKRIDLRNKRIVPVRQPKVGWDTLQWCGDPERTNHHLSGRHSDNGMPFELVGAGSALDPNYIPRAEVAWQARVVPVAPGVDSTGDAVLVNHAAVVTH